MCGTAAASRTLRVEGESVRLRSDDDRRDRDAVRDLRVERTVHRDWTAFDHPTTAIVETIAEVRDTDPMDVSPLHDHVDTDALDALVTRSTDSGAVTVSFTYDDARVLVDSDGDLTVYVRNE